MQDVNSSSVELSNLIKELEQSSIAIVLDNVVYSAPGVTSGAITGGISQITGNFDISETKDLAFQYPKIVKELVAIMDNEHIESTQFPFYIKIK